MSGDIVKRLRQWDDGGISTHWSGCMDAHPVCAILFAADTIEARDAEIVWLRALTAEQALVHDAWLAERDLADQLAEALGNSHDDPDGRFNRQAVNALAAWGEARREQ